MKLSLWVVFKNLKLNTLATLISLNTVRLVRAIIVLNTSLAPYFVLKFILGIPKHLCEIKSGTLKFF